MNSITTATELKSAIQQLEYKQAEDLHILKEDLRNTYESFKLINIIKSTFKEVIAVPDLKTTVINAAIGLTTGIVAKKLIIGKTINPLRKLFGIILEVAVAKKVANNTGGIKTLGNIIINKLFNQQNGSIKV